MTSTQLKGMLRFHKAAYRAYKQAGKMENARQARARMLQTYLEIRANRKEQK